MLNIIETLKEFCTILLGYKIEVHADHKKIMHKTTLMASDFLMRWGLILEDYGPGMHYVPGPESIVVDDMSRIPMIDNDAEVKKSYVRKISTIIGLFARTGDITKDYPLNIAIIARHQKT